MIFKQLGKDAMIQITEILVAELSTRLAEKNIRLKVDKKVVQLVTEKGTNLRMGARPFAVLYKSMSKIRWRMHC